MIDPRYRSYVKEDIKPAAIHRIQKTCEKYPGHYAPSDFSLTPLPLQPLPLFSPIPFGHHARASFCLMLPHLGKKALNIPACVRIFLMAGKGGRVMQTMEGGWIQWVVSAKWD
ncbi:hypothetical protein CDAR_43451 [Caerostris darwini]|uniref:Uncharacterized protein n=1 Tax=Caerostris darwini TaxID=1538125 RepID=A0AAV4WGD4_9ARAC|nr:hypothetical protein CDAR_43451 [Caerostris darwini]